VPNLPAIIHSIPYKGLTRTQLTRRRRSLWGLDVVEFPQCVWKVTVLNLEQMQNGKFMMDIISALMQQSL
jgi:hypothetical protein